MEVPVPLIRMALGLVAGLLLALGHGGLVLLAAPLVALVAARPTRAGAAGLLLGLLLGGRTGEAEPPLAADLDLPALHLLEGEVVSASPPGPDGVRAILALHRLDDRPAGGLGVRLGLGPGRGPRLRPGDRIRLPAMLRRLRRPTNPGQVERRRPGVHLRAWANDPSAVEAHRPSRGPLAWIAARRLDAAASLDRRLAPRDAALARALLLGDRTTLGHRDRARFGAAGQGHLIAVSGLHVGLLLAALLLGLRRLGVGPRTTAGLGLLAVLLYVPFAGAPPSAVRAGAGACVLFLARILGRRVSGPCTLAAVAVGVMVLEPSSIADVALALSLVAVLGILLLTPRFTRAFVPVTTHVPGLLAPPRALFRKAFAVSLAAWLGSAPLLATFLGRLCLVAAPVSVATVPLAAVLVASGFLLLGVGGIPGAEDLCAFTFALAADALRMLLDVVPAVGLGARAVRAPDPAWAAVWTAVLLGLGLGFIRRVGYGLLAVAVLLGLLHVPAGASWPDTVELTLLDVGHGQAALLRVPDGRAALLDCGRMGDPTVGRRLVVPALGALGVRRLALIAVSHGDADHAGGVRGVVERLDVDRVVVEAWHGDVLLEGAWGTLEVLAPAPGASGSRNDTGLALRLQTRSGRRVLFPGDRQDAGVAELLALEPDLEADVLVLPHHGLPSAARERLLDAVRPTHRVASVGASAVGLMPPGALPTGALGALTIRLAPEGVAIEMPFAEAPRRYDAAPVMPSLLALALVALGLLVVATLSVRPFRWLTGAGAAGAFVLGTASFAAFSWPGLAALFAPFLGANLLGRLPGASRSPARSLVQVAANGLPALLGCGLALAGAEAVGAAVFLGALACLGADTCATEVGVRYGGTPRSLIGGRRLARGESGGVTAAGLAASVGGAFLAPLAALALGAVTLEQTGWIAVAGVAAGLLDSVLGATLQYRGRDAATGAVVEARRTAAGPTERTSGLGWLDNDGVNLVAGLAGAAIAAGLLAWH